MKALRNILIFVLFALLLASCAVCKPCKPIVEYRDSIVIHERIVHDTVKFEVPVEIVKIVTRDTVSHLENSFAKSDAAVIEGFLHHSLESKPQVIYIPVEITVADTSSYHSETPEPQIIEVEKKLTWWQQARLNLFGWVFFFLCISLIYIFRKPLLALLRLIKL